MTKQRIEVWVDIPVYPELEWQPQHIGAVRQALEDSAWDTLREYGYPPSTGSFAQANLTKQLD